MKKKRSKRLPNDWEKKIRNLAALACYGPSGIERPLPVLWARYEQELAELLLANDYVGMLEEGADCIYYLGLLLVNGEKKAEVSRLARVIVDESGYEFDTLVIAAAKKYSLRFIKHHWKKAQSKPEEREALQKIALWEER